MIQNSQKIIGLEDDSFGLTEREENMKVPSTQIRTQPKQAEVSVQLLGEGKNPS